MSTPTTDQSSAVPTRKVTAGLLGGAVVTLLAWVLTVTVGLEPPPAVVAAATTLVGFALSYFVRERAV